MVPHRVWAMCHCASGGWWLRFIRSREGLSHSDIQYHFVPLGYNYHGRATVQREAYQVSAGVETQLTIISPIVNITMTNVIRRRKKMATGTFTRNSYSLRAGSPVLDRVRERQSPERETRDDPAREARRSFRSAHRSFTSTKA